MPSMVPAETAERIVRAYRDTRLPVDEIARRYGVSERTVHREVQRAGLPLRSHWITEQDAARVVRLYADGKGMTMAQIIRATGFGAMAVRKALRAAGVKIRRGRRYNR